MKTKIQLKKSAFGALVIILLNAVALGQDYKIVDTKQVLCYDTLNQITPPSPGDPFYGQDAQYDGNQPS